MFKKKALLSLALTFSLLFSCYATGLAVSPAKAATRSVDNTARYIRDSINGSTSNSGNHWVELEAWSNGVNVALHKPVTSNRSAVPGYEMSLATDGITSGEGWTTYYFATDGGPTWMQVDLGRQYVIDSISVWHWFLDNRAYHDAKTQISADGVNWQTVFDSNVSGEYHESSSGHTLCLDISVTYPSDIAFKIDPNQSIPFSDASIPIRNNSDLPVKIFLQGVMNTTGGNLTLTNAPPSKYSNWERLTVSQTRSNIAFAIRVKEAKTGLGTWSSISQAGTVFTANMSKTLMGTLNAKATGTVVLTGNCGLAWDKQYQVLQNLSLVFES